MGGEGSGRKPDVMKMAHDQARPTEVAEFGSPQDFELPNYSGVANFNEKVGNRLQRHTNLADPIEEQDSATKNYVDSQASKQVVELFLTNNLSEISVQYRDLEIDVPTNTFQVFSKGGR